jgi:TonB family protein
MVMRKIYYLMAAAVLLCGLPLWGQQRAASSAEDVSVVVMQTVEEMPDSLPEFRGGNKALLTWLSDNLRYPEEAVKERIQGRVMLSFLVEKDGSISDVIVVRSVAEPLDKEAVRLINTMPKWQPAMKDGEPVPCKYTLPITFRLPAPEETTE